MFMKYFVYFFLDAATVETRILMKQESISVNLKTLSGKLRQVECLMLFSQLKNMN